MINLYKIFKMFHLYIKKKSKQIIIMIKAKYLQILTPHLTNPVCKINLQIYYKLNLILTKKTKNHGEDFLENYLLKLILIGLKKFR